MSEQARTTARRRAVMAAVVAVTDHLEQCIGGAQPLRAFQVRFFGIAECVDASLSTIDRDLRWLEQQGYVSRPRRDRAEFAPTDEGRAWIA